MIRLALAVPGLRITAIDGSAPMIALARDAIRTAGLEDRVTLLRGQIRGCGSRTTPATRCLEGLLHHLPDPSVLWKEARRLGRSGAAVYVMDLIRPSSPADARRIVDSVAASEDPDPAGRFLQFAARRVYSRRGAEQVAAAGLGIRVGKASDRHVLISGVTSP